MELITKWYYVINFSVFVWSWLALWREIKKDLKYFFLKMCKPQSCRRSAKARMSISGPFIRDGWKIRPPRINWHHSWLFELTRRHSWCHCHSWPCIGRYIAPPGRCICLMPTHCYFAGYLPAQNPLKAQELWNEPHLSGEAIPNQSLFSWNPFGIFSQLQVSLRNAVD